MTTAKAKASLEWEFLLLQIMWAHHGPKNQKCTFSTSVTLQPLKKSLKSTVGWGAPNVGKFYRYGGSMRGDGQRFQGGSATHQLPGFEKADMVLHYQPHRTHHQNLVFLCIPQLHVHCIHHQVLDYAKTDDTVTISLLFWWDIFPSFWLAERLRARQNPSPLAQGKWIPVLDKQIFLATCPLGK